LPRLRSGVLNAGSTRGELEHIQFLLVHRLVKTTERFIGTRHGIAHAVNDWLGIEPDAFAPLEAHSNVALGQAKETFAQNATVGEKVRYLPVGEKAYLVNYFVNDAGS
jgi:hypothetical protein